MENTKQPQHLSSTRRHTIAPPPLLLPHELLAKPAAGPAVAKTPTKKRALSDSAPVLEPSPKIREAPDHARIRDDDASVLATPSRAPKRTLSSARGGLHLQMPPRDPAASSVQNLGARAGTQSPQTEYESREVYGSPSSVLPRHSRGLDFSRACTNLHHSTLAEQSSPDSSPTVAQRGFMPPSRRNSTYAMTLDSPRPSYSAIWHNFHTGDRQLMPRSVTSTNALTSEASSSSDDEDDVSMLQDEPDDSMIATPLVRRSTGGSSTTTPFAIPIKGAESTTWTQQQSPGPPTFFGYRNRILLPRRHSRQSHGSWTSRSRTASPDGGYANATNSNTNNTNNNNTANTCLESRGPAPVNADQMMRSPASRRDSLSLGIGSGLRITSSNESGDENNAFNLTPMTPGVVRRAVTRRSNMLPKSKNFARIRAALQEEAAPVDSEARRESEVVRQVRVKDVGLKELGSAMPTSPDLTPSVPNLTHESSEMSEIEALSAKGGYEGPPKNEEHTWRRSSSDQLDTSSKASTFARSRTPPPNLFLRHRSSSGVSEDLSMDSPYASTPPSSVLSAASTALPDSGSGLESAVSTHFPVPALPSAAEVTRKAHNKRRRDDDFDPNSIKRRAVSPGVSSHNSPVMGQSPASTNGQWGKSSKAASEKSSGGSGNEEKPSSATTTGHVTPVLGPTRVGLQGMVDTNDGLMNMSIE